MPWHGTQLPSVGAASSTACPSVPGFEPKDTFPTRSPLVVADHLINLVRGKSFAEIGTRNGDIFGCVRHFAASATAIELDRTYCRMLEARGFDVLCRNFMSLRPEEMPPADVLYWWPQMSWHQNEQWMRHAIHLFESSNRSVTVVVGFDSHWAADMVSLPRMMRRFRGHAVQRLFFDEGGTWRDVLPSMQSEFRPGRRAPPMPPPQ